MYFHTASLTGSFVSLPFLIESDENSVYRMVCKVVRFSVQACTALVMGIQLSLFMLHTQRAKHIKSERNILLSLTVHIFFQIVGPNLH